MIFICNSSWLILVLLAIFIPLTYMNMSFLPLNVKCNPSCSFLIPIYYNVTSLFN